MSKIEHENCSRSRDLGTRTTDLEDWILANFCVIAGLSTIGFVAWYWMKVIKLAVWSVLYWTHMMTGLCLLFWLFKRAIHFYRKRKGLKFREAWGFLIVVNVLQLYNNFEQLKADGTLGKFLEASRLFSEALKFPLYVPGFIIGRGPLFDYLPDEWKAARGGCKTWNDVANFLAVFAGPSDEEGGNKEYSRDRNDIGEAYFSPW
ncbi:hypothetical protein DM02DRAFT_685936, partial [Periconia macrospinosa]